MPTEDDPNNQPTVPPRSAPSDPGYSAGNAATLPPNSARADLATVTQSSGDPTRRDGAGVVPGYEILGELGRGGMGVVYKARDIRLNRTVALKMVLSGSHADARELVRFLAEAEAVASVRHPHVVQVHGYGEHDGRPYMALEFCEGGTLTGRIHQNERLAPAAAAEVVEEVARGVQAAHDLGIVHRDLKPANILLTADGAPKVTDFGLAKRGGGSGMTQSNAVMGTPAYMAPEQAQGRTKFVGPAADVYALGVILYECLAGRPPFESEDTVSLIMKVVEEDPPPLARFVSGVPRDLELICRKCLAKEARERYATASELADDLRRFRTGEPVSVRPPGRLEVLAKWARRKPTLAAAYGLTAFSVLAIGLVVGAVWLWQRAEGARELANQSKAEVEIQRDAAQTAGGYAVTQRDIADKLRQQVEREREKMAVFEYGRTMQVAHQEWRDNNISGALPLLEGMRNDLRGWEWHYVHRLCHSDLLTLKDTFLVTSVSFSRDGERIVTASDTVRVWDTKTGAELLALKKFAANRYASLSADGTRIVTGSFGYVAKVWDAKSGTELLTLKGHSKDVTSVSFSSDGSRIVTASSDQTTKVWDAKTGTELHTLKGHSKDVTSAAFSSDGMRIVTASFDGTAKVWDAETGADLLTLKGHSKDVTAAAFNSDGTRIVTANGEGTAEVWDAKTGAELLTLKGHTGAVSSAAFSEDGGRIVTASFDNTAKVWDAKTGTELLTFKGHSNFITVAAFSRDGARVVTGSWDNTTKVWDAKTGTDPVVFKGQAVGVHSALFNKTGSQLVTGNGDGTAKVWDANTGVILFTLKSSVRSAAFSEDGSRIVTASFDGTAKVWDAKTQTAVATLKGHSKEVTSAVFSADGSRIVTASSDQTAKVWDAKTGTELATLKGHTSAVSSAAFSGDGTRIVTASSDQTAKVWDAKTGGELFTLKGHARFVSSASFSSDGARIVTASWDNTAKVWDAKTGTELVTLKGHTLLVSSAAFSGDGTRIVTASLDKTARVWDAKTGAELLTLKERALVNSASFSSDGTRIVTANGDGTAIIWDSRPINRAFRPQ